jgi:CIC family chloride channel protein
VRIHTILEIPIYVILGIISAFFAIIYVKTFYGVHTIFKKLRVPNHVKPMIGGFLTGLVGLLIPTALGMGYGYVQALIDGKLTLTIILLTIIGKIVATSFTISSGGSGGVFGPSIVIGSFIGGAIGYIFHQIMPNIVVQPESYILVGMSAFIAGACKTPIAGILMTAEMTGGYHLLPALMLSSSIAYLLTRDYTIYIEQLPTRVESPAHRAEMIIDVLEDVPVKDAMSTNVIVVTPDQTILDVMNQIERTGHLGFPVVEEDKLVGIITFTDVEKIPINRKSTVRVREVMTANPIVTYPDESLKIALEKMILRDISRLPVIKDGKLVGIITKGDVIKFYAKIRRNIIS